MPSIAAQIQIGTLRSAGTLASLLITYLFLASGGYALADFNASTTAIHSFSDSDTVDGWTEGAGTEYAWTDNLILRAEYRHAEFGEAGLSLDGSSQDISSGQDMVQVGASWKF